MAENLLCCCGTVLCAPHLQVERWGMHKRVAFSIVGTMGGRGMSALLGGFMLAVWLLSMWISNTATILAMLPVAEAFLASLPKGKLHTKLLSPAYRACLGQSAVKCGI